MLQIQSPFQQLFDTNGSPLDDGYVYIGTANTNPETSPIAIYWDDAGTIPAAQPIRTLNGYIVRNGTPARVYTAAEDFSMTVKDKQGRVVFSVLDATADSNLTTALAASSGSSLIGFLQAGTGAVTRTVQSKLRDVVSVKDFGAVGDGVADDTAAIQAALNEAGSRSITDASFSGSFYYIKGGATVYLPAGVYLTSSTLTIPQNVSIEGDGKYSSIIKSSYNGQILRNTDSSPVAGTYDKSGTVLRKFSIIGDRTQASQVGLDLLRMVFGSIEDVSVTKCGSHGIVMSQCALLTCRNLEAIYNKGTGLILRDGFNTWATSGTPNNLPSNAITFWGFHAAQNDGAGLKTMQFGSTTGVNGCVFNGGAIESNYWTGADGVGYNIEITGGSYLPNEFNDIWVEASKDGLSNAGVKAHIYVDCTNVGTTVRFNRLHHVGNGNYFPERAAIVEKGTLVLNGAYGTSTDYKTVAGSKSPFRLNLASGVAIIRARECRGSNCTGILQFENESGNRNNMNNALFVDGSDGVYYGDQTMYGDATGTNVQWFYNGETQPRYKLDMWTGYLAFGGGSTAPDAQLERKAANVIGMATGDSFQVGGVAGETLKYNAGTANGSVATTLGSVGPTGSTAGNPQGWLRVNVAGTDRFVPYW